MGARITAAFIAGLGIAGTVIAVSSDAVAFDNETKLKATASASGAVQRKLRDPDSAQFRNMAAYEPAAGALVVCGQVNAKNGFGGYTGYQPFVWVPLGPDMKPNVRNGMAFVGADEIGDKASLCRNAEN